MIATRQPSPQRYGKQRKPGLGVRQKLWILGTGVLVVLIAIGVAGFGMFKLLERSDFFQLTAIKIQGCRRTTKKQILDLSGVDVHTNLLALRIGKVRQRLESHPWVQAAEVEREWPNRLQIVIRERVPVAMASTSEGFFYLDRYGTPFVRVLPPEDMDYPVISGLSREKWPGRVKGSPLGRALDFLRFASRGGAILPGQNISEIHLQQDGEMVLYLVDRPFPIYLGTGERMLTTYYRLARVLYHLYKTKEFPHVAAIQMDYLPDRVLVRKVDAG